MGKKGKNLILYFYQNWKTTVLLSSSSIRNNANKNKRNNSEDHTVTKVLNTFIMKAKQQKKLTTNTKKGYLKIKTRTKQ